MRRSSIYVVLCVLLCAALFSVPRLSPAETAASAPSGQNAQAIPIAAIYSRTGFAAVHNRSVMEVTQLTADQINREGGVLGKQLQLIMIDNRSTAIGSREAALKAIELGVVGVIGSDWSSHSLAMAPALQAAGIPMITPASTHPGVTAGRDYVFRACWGDRVQGETMARFARERLGLNTVVILRNVDEAYCTKLADFFYSSFISHGGKVLNDASYRGHATDFSEQISDILELQPDAVYIPGYARDTALFMKQARKQGVEAVFLGGDGWDILERLVPNEVEGSFQTVHWHPQVEYPPSDEVKELYKEAYGLDLNHLIAPLGYDSVKLLVAAIEKAGETDPAKIRDALASLEYAGATGEWTFDNQGNPMGKKVIIVTYRGGKIEYFDAVEPYDSSSQRE